MKENRDNRNLPVQQLQGDEMNTLPGYPSYPAKDDIFNKYKEEKNINPDDISKNKSTVDALRDAGINNTVIDETASGRDLDVPGSELDDNEEDIGSEDEENNYYSLGGDGHAGLDENSGE